MKAGAKFFNKSCPVCTHPFHTEDEVIICPECERPHHATCWHKNHGCGLIDCQGGKDHRKKSSKKRPAKKGKDTSHKESITCPVCEAAIEKHVVRCPYCETRLKRKGLYYGVRISLIMAFVTLMVGGGWYLLVHVSFPFLERRDRETVEEEDPLKELSPHEYVRDKWNAANYQELKSFLETEGVLQTDPDFFYPYLVGVYLQEDNISPVLDAMDELQQNLSSSSFHFLSGIVYAAAEKNEEAENAFHQYNFSFHRQTPQLHDIIRFIPPEVNFEYVAEKVYLEKSEEVKLEHLQEKFDNWQWRVEEGVIVGELSDEV